MSKEESNDRERLRELSRRLREDDSTVLQEILTHLASRTGRALKLRFQATVADADVEDALSIALFRLWQRRKAFDPGRSNLASWFYLLARNASVDLLRQKGRREQPMADVLDSFSAPFEPHESSTYASAGELSGLRRNLSEALAQLSESDRQLLLSDRPAAELAAELGITSTLVRVRKLRLRQKLRRMLGQESVKEGSLTQ
jgi:RNA polymerase sigma factor (sigma-70 family)